MELWLAGGNNVHYIHTNGMQDESGSGCFGYRVSDIPDCASGKKLVFGDMIPSCRHNRLIATVPSKVYPRRIGEQYSSIVLVTPAVNLSKI